LKSLVSITIKIEYIAFTKFSHGNLNWEETLHTTKRILEHNI
jgi:CO dehydrogenase/acetyl-CoA synthase epsilon subunit